MLERLYFPADLGRPWDSPEKAGPSAWGEGSPGFSIKAVAPVYQVEINGKKWMDGKISLILEYTYALN